MVAYHFSFDLRYFGLTQWDFYRDPFWLNARTVILSSFLLIAGVSLVLAERARTSPARFWRHVGIIAACALAVSGARSRRSPRPGSGSACRTRSPYRSFSRGRWCGALFSRWSSAPP